jgi:Aspartyl/Asparaginyl beta-hydroxylase
MSIPELLQDADRAAAHRDFGRAASLLEQAAQLAPDDASLWMRLAAMRRGTGQPARALEAVHKALAIHPRDFTGLLMRASLMQRLGDPNAGEAWGHALAQRPDGELPPHVAPIVKEAEHHYEEWRSGRDAEFKAAMAKADERADPEQRKRIERFRSNVLRRTKPYHSEPTDYFFPELTEREFHPRRLFPWIEQLEAATPQISAELQQVMTSERAELVPYVQYEEHVPMDQWRPLNHSPDWTAIHLIRQGKVIDVNARHCPQTMDILERLPQPQIAGASPNAMFSLLAPSTKIPPHVGINNARLVCHLPLVVPEGCWFRVGGETRLWKVGEAFVFDDTMEHEAMNPTDQLRVVFIFDVWHPDLSPVERDAIAALIGCRGSLGQAL